MRLLVLYTGFVFYFLLMLRRPPRSTRTYTRFLDTTLFRSPNNRLDTKLNTKSAATFGGELGHDLGGARVGLELAYQRNKVKGITLKSLTGTPITAEVLRSEEHTSELQSLMRKPLAVFCVIQKNPNPFTLPQCSSHHFTTT